MKSLYLECGTGISGDMIVAALLDLGADEDVLRKALKGIKDESFHVEISRVMKAGIDCCDFNVVLDKDHENHDHDMEYLYGHEKEDGMPEDRAFTQGEDGHEHRHDHEHHHDHHHEHDHDHDHGHDHDDHHDHDHHHDHEHSHDDHHDHEHHHHHDHEHDHEHSHEHDHHHRGLQDIMNIIDDLDITPGARFLAKKTFLILAEAESKAHRKTMEQVHFHEAGAIDSIVDIVAAAVCFDDLGIDEVVITQMVEGHGSVRCQHGILPVPVPAVANIATKHNLPLSITNRKGELITPTGAAFAAAVMTTDTLPETFVPQKIGLGAGKREYKQPSMVRAILFQGEEPMDKDAVWKLETNVDDCTGEQLGFLMEKLMDKGARDAFFTPVFMKKNRPAWMITVLASEEKVGEMEDILFLHTSTIGVRREKMSRTVLPREEVEAETQYGTVKAKVSRHKGRIKIAPEYESMARIARETGAPLEDIYRQTTEAFRRSLK